MEIENDNSLENFGGWGTPSDVDFFSQQDNEPVVNTDAKSVIEELQKDEKTEVTKEVKTEPEVSKENDLFNETSVQEITNEEVTNEDTPNDETPNIYVLNKLKEKGFIEYELEEGEELTEELAEELLEDKFDESVENKVKELMTDLPEDGKQMIQYLIKGGSLTDFINTLSSENASIDMKVDLEKEENQISVMKKLLKLEDKDDEEIETEIEFLKDSGKLKLMTEKKFGKYKTEFDNKQKDLLEQQEKAIEDEKKAIKQAKSKVATFLSESQDADGIKFSKEDKKELPSYMNDKTVKLQNGAIITQMQKELFYDLPKNEKALIQLATLLKNRNEDGTFNFDSIVNSTKTKVTQEVKQEIRRNKSSIPGSSTTKVNKSDKSLSDYFN